MDEQTLKREFREKICKEIDIKKEGKGRYLIFTPFMFEDGDHLSIILKQEKEGWRFTDEGHTFMHISYEDIDIDRTTRKKIVDSVLLSYGIQNIKGELIISIEKNEFGDAIYNFIQGLIKITDISFLTRERVRSTFLDDFKILLGEKVKEERRNFDYYDEKNDPEKKYIVDCKINGAKSPVFVFAILNDDKCRDATITCYHYEKVKTTFIATAIFENQEEINRRVLSRFSDVCEKQFSSLQSATERVDSYLKRYLQ